jgi:hypothetical protein
MLFCANLKHWLRDYRHSPAFTLTALATGPACSPAKFQHYRERNSVVQDVSAFRTGVVNLPALRFLSSFNPAR